jgi:hypothetical protein
MLVRLLKVETGKSLQVLEGHLGPVYTVCFAPTGELIFRVNRAEFLKHSQN